MFDKPYSAVAMFSYIYRNNVIFTITDRKCDVKADIVFLYDDSSSISSNNPGNFNIMKTFMKNVVSKFSSFGPNGVEFSAVCFSDKVTPHFNLKKYSTEAGLLQGITNDVNPSNGGATHIGSGLKVRKT